MKGLAAQGKGTTDLPPATRRSDPPTSRAAEIAHRLNRESHCALLLDAVRKQPGMTSAEYAQWTGLERHEAARRCADLKNQGAIVGARPRRCDVGKKMAVTWWLGPKGAKSS